MKETNPKDAIGVLKLAWSVLPWHVIGEVALALLEGALKYGRHNWRVAGVRASVYHDATDRHIKAWWEGRDIDPHSGLHEITKAIASLVVLRDAVLQGKLTDDRPPPDKNPDWIEDLNARAKAMIEKVGPSAVPAYTRETPVLPPPSAPSSFAEMREAAKREFEEERSNRGLPKVGLGR